MFYLECGVSLMAQVIIKLYAAKQPFQVITVRLLKTSGEQRVHINQSSVGKGAERGAAKVRMDDYGCWRFNRDVVT